MQDDDIKETPFCKCVI